MLALLFSNSSAANDSLSNGHSFVKAYELVTNIQLIRIEESSVTDSKTEGCKYKYRANVLSLYKGTRIKSFYSSDIAIVGGRYLMVGNVASICGTDAPSVGFLGIPSMFPLLPYGFDLPDKDTWVAFGASEYEFPKGIHVLRGDHACYVASPVGLANPCPVPPPFVEFEDVEKLLRGLRLGRVKLDRP